MGWFGGKIKHFFWSMMISGALLIIANSSATSRGLMDQAIKMIRAHTHRASVTQANSPNGSDRSIVQEIRDSVPQTLGEVAEDLSSTVASASGSTTQDEYVLINGRYYRARADHTYLVNGEKIYFVNNRQPPKRVGQLLDENENLSSEPSHAANSASTGEGLPTSPSELMETLKKSQKAFQERNRALEEIMKEK